MSTTAPATVSPIAVTKPAISRMAAALLGAEKQAPQPKSFKMGSVLDYVKEGESLTLQVTVPGKDKVWAIVLAPETAPLLLQIEEELNRDCPKAASAGKHAK